MLKLLKFCFPISLLVAAVSFGSYSCTSSAEIDNDTHFSIDSEEDMVDSNILDILLMPFLSNDKWGFIDTTGHLIIPSNYKSVHGFTEGLAAVKVDSLWGFIDKNNQWVIEPEFDSCQPFFGNRAAVMRYGQWGFIDGTGDQSIPFQYNHVKPFCEGLAAVSDGNKWGFIDTSNNTVIDFIYDGVHTGFYYGKANVISGVKLFSVDSMGKQYPPYDEPVIFNAGLSLKTGSNKKKGYVNASGEFVIEPIYVMAGHFSEGLASVSLDHVNFGFIDTSGKMVIPPTYFMVGEFNNGLASAQDYDNMNCGFIDKQGNWVIQPEYFHAEDFSGECAPVSNDQHEWQLINRKGEFVTDIYKDIVSVKIGLSLPGGLPAFGNVKGLIRKDAPLALLVNETEFKNLFWALTNEGWIIIDSYGQKVVSEPQPSRVAFN